MTIARRWAYGLAALALLGAALALSVWLGSDARAIAKCRNGPENFAPLCYTNLIESALKNKGLPAALQVVAQAGAVDPDFAQYCHSNMHELGAAAYDMYHKTGRIDISPELSYCGFGFYHGFMEEMFAETGTVDEAQAFCNALSLKLTDQTSAVSNCYHGIGHGITDGYDPRTRGDPAAIVAPGLALCTKISADQELHRSCAMGVFNSVELMYEDPKNKLDLSRGPFALCARPYTIDEKNACYTEMSVLSISLFNGDYAKAFESASGADPAYRGRVAAYIALFAMGQDFSGEHVVTACKKVLKGYDDACVKGVAQGLIKYGKPGHEYDAAIAFCGGADLSTREKGMCKNTIVTTDVYTPAELKSACGHFQESDMPTACTKTT